MLCLQAMRVGIVDSTFTRPKGSAMGNEGNSVEIGLRSGYIHRGTSTDKSTLTWAEPVVVLRLIIDLDKCSLYACKLFSKVPVHTSIDAAYDGCNQFNESMEH